MRICAVLILTVGVALSSLGAQHHDTKYLMGGYATTSTFYWNGVWMADTGTQTVKHLTANSGAYMSSGSRAIMAANNKDVLFSAAGTTSSSYSSLLRSGIFSVDPNSLSISTIYADTLLTSPTYAVRNLIINQDGDYVYQNYGRQTGTTFTTYRYSIMKLDAGKNITTILTSVNTGGGYLYTYGLGINIDNGHYLVNARTSGSTNSIYYAVLNVAEDGTFTTFRRRPHQRELRLVRLLQRHRAEHRHG